MTSRWRMPLCSCPVCTPPANSASLLRTRSCRHLYAPWESAILQPDKMCWRLAFGLLQWGSILPVQPTAAGSAGGGVLYASDGLQWQLQGVKRPVSEKRRGKHGHSLTKEFALPSSLLQLKGFYTVLVTTLFSGISLYFPGSWL